MTRFNNKYPYTDFHELNADWLLETVKDAEAEAKEASDTVATYNDRLTTVEGDLAPIKAAMPGLASDVSGLRHDVGIMDSLITNTINPGLSTLQNEVETASTGLLDRMTAAEGSISTLKNEVETPSTGLLDRVTALENQPVPSANAVYYLEFDSSLVSIDPDNAYDSRIKYDWLKQFVPLNVSGEDTHVIKLYDSHTQKVYDLAAFHLQESVSPDGKFVFTNRAEHTTGGIIDYYVNSTVTVLQSATNPTFAEENESLLPAVTSTDAGDVLTVDNNGDWVAAAPSALPAVTSADKGKTLAVDSSGNWALANGSGVKHEMTVNSSLFEKLDGYYIDCGDYFVVRIKVRALGSVSQNDNIFTGGPVVTVAPYIFGFNLGSNSTHVMYVSTGNPGYINSFASASSGNVIDCTAVVVK